MKPKDTTPATDSAEQFLEGVKELCRKYDAKIINTGGGMMIATADSHILDLVQIDKNTTTEDY